MSLPCLTDVATLASRLSDPGWCIIDCRHQLSDPEAGARAYQDGHIPGAHFLHLDRDLSGAMTGRNGRHPLPDREAVAARFAACGISPGLRVVAYDDAGGMIAARIWWLLRWLGHAEVSVLDGGIDAWKRAGMPLDQQVPRAAAGRLTPLPPLLPVVGQDVVREMVRTGAACLVDARAPDRFHGENETLDPVGGHIPGARNRFFRDNLDADGCFRQPAELHQAWLALLAGVPAEKAVFYCGSGVSACVNLLALEWAGLPGGQLYAGSWSEWCADPGNPVAR